MGTKTPTPLDSLTKIRTANRANFDPMSVTGSSTILSEDIKKVISFVQDFLTVSPQAYWYVRDGKQENLAIGVQFDLGITVTRAITPK
jgi:hypothetical protein